MVKRYCLQVDSETESPYGPWVKAADIEELKNEILAKSDAEAEKLIREVLEWGRLRDSLWEAAALRWLGEDRVYCGCLNPIWKHRNGVGYCTACGNFQRDGGVEHG